MLVKAGAEVNSHVGEIGSALQSAAYCANIEAADALIAHGAQTDENKSFYRPDGTAGGALERAAISGNQELIERLIRHGAGVNSEIGWAGTALDLSLRHLNPGLTRFLLSHGEDPSIYYGYNISSTHNICSSPESISGREILVMLLEAKSSGVELNHYPYGTPPPKSYFYGRKTIVDLFLSLKADVMASSGQSGDALQSASIHQNDLIVTALLDHGANPDSDSKLLRGRTSINFQFLFYGGITILQGAKGWKNLGGPIAIQPLSAKTWTTLFPYMDSMLQLCRQLSGGGTTRGIEFFFCSTKSPCIRKVTTEVLYKRPPFLGRSTMCVRFLIIQPHAPILIFVVESSARHCKQ